MRGTTRIVVRGLEMSHGVLRVLSTRCTLCFRLSSLLAKHNQLMWSPQGDGHAINSATHAFMARFRTKHELRQYVATAPVQALQHRSSAVLPFALELLLAFDVAPPKQSKAVPPPKL